MGGWLYLVFKICLICSQIMRHERCVFESMFFEKNKKSISHSWIDFQYFLHQFVFYFFSIRLNFNSIVELSWISIQLSLNAMPFNTLFKCNLIFQKMIHYFDEMINWLLTIMHINRKPSFGNRWVSNNFKI